MWVFTKEEVEEDIKQMAPLKSPGPDGFGVVFYQKNWSIVGTDVYETVLSILYGEGMNSFPKLHFYCIDSQEA